MFRILTQRENCIRFLQEMGLEALLQDKVKNEFKDRKTGRESYEMTFLQLLKDLGQLSDYNDQKPKSVISKTQDNCE